MNIYQLEERILFDGALPVDIAEPADPDFLDVRDETDPEYQKQGDQKETKPEDKSDSSEDNNKDLENDSSEAKKKKIAGKIFDEAVAGLESLVDNSENKPDVLLVSCDNKNMDKIKDSAKDDTRVVEYEPDSSFDAVINKLKESLGDEIPYDIALVDADNSDLEFNNNEKSKEFYNELRKINSAAGELHLISVESGKDSQLNLSVYDLDFSKNGWDIESAYENTLTEYFETDSELISKNTELETRSNEVIFINSSVMDSEEIVNDLPEDADIVYLTKGEDGVEEINEYLSEKENVDTVRIFSHGNDGYFVLNGEIIDSNYLSENGDKIAQWSEHLSEDADIMLYGCNLAETSEGQDFVDSIAELAGADVAASRDAIGGADALEDITVNSMDSGWDLEYSAGLIQSPELSISGYQYKLNNYTVTDGGNAGSGTLRYGIKESDYGEITFDVDTVTLSDEIKIINEDIGNELTIDGSNTNVTVEVEAPGSSTFRVFNIDTGGASVTIENMTIKGGDISENDENGGAIKIENGSVNLENVTVSGSKADLGGGVYNYDGAPLTLTENTICGNEANVGGGIYNREGNLTLKSSTIFGNKANDKGGGIRNWEGDLRLEDSTVRENITENGDGGGLANANKGSIKINNSTISDNEAGNKGGAIYNTANITQVNSTVSGNTADNTAGIYNEGNLYAANSIIAYNYNSDQSGYSDINNKTSVYGNYNISPFTDADWNGNKNTKYDYSAGKGESLFLEYSMIERDVLYKPLLTNNGGGAKTVPLVADSQMAYEYGTKVGIYRDNGTNYAFYNDGWKKVNPESSDPSNVTEIKFDQRGVSRTESISGTEYRKPAIGAYQLGDKFQTKDSGHWGTLDVWEGKSAYDYTSSQWQNVTSSDNIPDFVDESITINNNIDLSKNITIDQTTINSDGSLTIQNGNTLTVNNGAGIDLEVKGEYSLDNEGELANSGKSKVVYNGGDQNIAVGNYYELSFFGSSSESTKTFQTGITKVEHQIELGNSINLTGSSSEEVTVQVVTPAFDDDGKENENPSESRVLHIDADDGKPVNIENMTIKGGDISDKSYPDNYGGAIYAERGDVILESVEISDSKANMGGALYKDGDNSDLELKNSIIRGNAASEDGGGIINAGTMEILKTTISDNKANNSIGGGGIINAGILDILNTTISGNSASEEGGGIYNTNTLTLTNTTVSGNKADKTAGIYNEGNLYVANSIMAYNYKSSGNGYSDITNEASVYGNHNISSFKDDDWGGKHNIYEYEEERLFAEYKQTSSTSNLKKPILTNNGGGTKTVPLAFNSAAAYLNGTKIATYQDGTEYAFYDNDDNEWKNVKDGTSVSSIGSEITDDQRGVSRTESILGTEYRNTSIGAYQLGDKFQTQDSGDWDTLDVWEGKPAYFEYEVDWRPVTLFDNIPDYVNESIKIKDNIKLSKDITTDQTTINSDGSLTIQNSNILTVNNGAGTDFEVKGFLNNKGTLNNDTGANIDVKGAFDNKGTLTHTGKSKVVYSGGGQDIAAGDYYELSFSGSSSESTKIFQDGTTTLKRAVELNDSITLTGSSASNVTVKVANVGTTSDPTESRIFNISALTDDSVLIENMTIKGGDISKNDDNGGAILANSGNITLDSVEISDSQADQGGALYKDLENSDLIKLKNSTITNNTASSDVLGGGGIFNRNGNIEILNTTISGNKAKSSSIGGGGILNFGILEILNTTISGNSAKPDFAGGIYNEGNLYAANSIIAYNYNSDHSGYSDIINENSAYGNYNLSSFNEWGSQTEGNSNYIYGNTGKGNPLFVNYETIEKDKIYKPKLENNGGPTKTVALADDSEAKAGGVETGKYTDSSDDETKYAFKDNEWEKVTDGSSLSAEIDTITTDQRGKTRKDNPSIGAYELLYNYRTIADGDWSEVSLDNAVWERKTEYEASWTKVTDAANLPDYESASIDVGNSITLNSGQEIDQTEIANSGTLTVNNSVELTIDNGEGTDLTIEGDLKNNGTLTNRGEIINSGEFTNNGEFINNDNSKVVYDGADQSVASGTYYNLNFDGSENKILQGDIIIVGDLTLNSGKIVVDDNTLSLGKNSNVKSETGGDVSDFSKNNMIVTNENSTVRKKFEDTGKFLYPIGTLDDKAEYSPIEIEFTSGKFSNNSYVDVNVVDGKAPNNQNPTNYITRYWNVSSIDISNFNADIACEYLVKDVVGNEDKIYFGKYDGNRWEKYDKAITNQNILMGENIKSFSVISGIKDPDVPDINNGMMINDATNYETLTNSKTYGNIGAQTSIDKISADNFEVLRKENIGRSIMNYDLSVSTEPGDGAYGLNASSGEYLDTNGIYDIEGTKNKSEIEIGGENSELDELFGDSLDLSKADCVDHEALRIYDEERHPLFKNDLEKLLDEFV